MTRTSTARRNPEDHVVPGRPAEKDVEDGVHRALFGRVGIADIRDRGGQDRPGFVLPERIGGQRRHDHHLREQTRVLPDEVGSAADEGQGAVLVTRSGSRGLNL